MKNRFSDFVMAIAGVLMLFSSSAFANSSVGFSRGNNLNMMNLSGSIKLKYPCKNKSPKNYEIIKCESHDLYQGDEDYFIGPINSEATEIIFVSKGASGEVHEKKSDYYGSKGRTAGTVNLWHSTLFQNPLLEVGRNEIHYKLINDDGETLQSGIFLVHVSVSAEKECSEAVYNSLTSFECNMKHSVCQDYFRKNNFCQK